MASGAPSIRCSFFPFFNKLNLGGLAWPACGVQFSYDSHSKTHVSKAILPLLGSPSVLGSFSKFLNKFHLGGLARPQSRPAWDPPRGPILIRFSFKNKRFQSNYVASGVPLNPMVFFKFLNKLNLGGLVRPACRVQFSYNSHSKTHVFKAILPRLRSLSVRGVFSKFLVKFHLGGLVRLRESAGLRFTARLHFSYNSH